MNKIKHAAKILTKGGIIAYPTEAIYGLGCDPFNETAVHRIFEIKQRPLTKGLILIASEYSQIEDLIMPTKHMDEILKTWPGPNTWVFPVTNKVPEFLLGEFNALAVRITNHPISRSLCTEFGGPITSTSANISNDPPVKTWQELSPNLFDKIDYVVKGTVGDSEKCSSIRDASTLEVLR